MPGAAIGSRRRNRITEIVRSSIQLAHSFGMTVVAEGVETAGAARELQAYGCEFAQGYYFGYPQTAAEIEAQWLEPAIVTPRRVADRTAPA